MIKQIIDWQERYKNSIYCTLITHTSEADLFQHNAPHLIGEAAIALATALDSCGLKEAPIVGHDIFDAIINIRDMYAKTLLKDLCNAESSTTAEAEVGLSPLFDILKSYLPPEKIFPLMNIFGNSLDESYKKTKTLLTQKS